MGIVIAVISLIILAIVILNWLPRQEPAHSPSGGSTPSPGRSDRVSPSSRPASRPTPPTPTRTPSPPPSSPRPARRRPPLARLLPGSAPALHRRLHADECVPATLIVLLRRYGIDCSSTAETGLGGEPDDVQLAHARSQQRILLTFDRDFLRLSESARHCGIILLRRQRCDYHQVARFCLALPAAPPAPPSRKLREQAGRQRKAGTATTIHSAGRGAGPRAPGARTVPSLRNSLDSGK